jgi:hypothetical protein
MSIQIAMTASYNNMMNSFAKDVTEKLAENYGFDVTEALAYLEIKLVEKKTGGRKKKAEGEKVEKAPKKKSLKAELGFPIPFMGEINQDTCYGVKLESRLFTQCTAKREGEFDYCSKCQKTAMTLASGKPKYGDIRDRAEAPVLEYVDPNGQKELPLANVLGKKGILPEVARERLVEHGIHLDDAHFTPVELKRGRPSKSDASSVASTDKKIESVVDDDLLADVVNATKDAEVIDESKFVDAKSVKSEKSTKSKKDKKFKKMTLEDGTKAKYEKATHLVYVDGEVVGKFEDGELTEGKMVDGEFEPTQTEEASDADSDDSDSDSDDE